MHPLVGIVSRVGIIEIYLRLTDKQKCLIENFVRGLRKAPKKIQKLTAGHSTKTYKNYGNGVAKGLGL